LIEAVAIAYVSPKGVVRAYDGGGRLIPGATAGELMFLEIRGIPIYRNAEWVDEVDDGRSHTEDVARVL